MEDKNSDSTAALFCFQSTKYQLYQAINQLTSECLSTLLVVTCNSPTRVQEDMHEGCLGKVLSPSAPAQAGMLSILSTKPDCILVLFGIFLIAMPTKYSSNLGKTHFFFFFTQKLTGVKPISIVRRANLQNRSSIKSQMSMGSSLGLFDQIMFFKVCFKNVIPAQEEKKENKATK